MAVNLVFTGDSADAQAAIAKLERKYDELARKMTSVNNKTREPKGDTDDWNNSLDATVLKLGAAGGAMLALRAVGAGVGEEIKAWLDRLDDVAKKLPKESVKLEIQAGLKRGDFDKLMPQIEKELTETPVTDVKGAIAIQTQLASSGFKQADVDSGAALGQILDLKAATASFGEGDVDEKQAAKTSSMTLKGYGMENSAANMRVLNQKWTSLFKESDVQMGDFEQFAPKLSGLKNFGMTLNEALGTFSAGAEVLGGNKADSGLANFVDRAATAGAHPERVDALAEVGIKPEDIQFGANGKSFLDNLDTMRKKFSAADVGTRNNVISKTFGQDAAPMANYLLSDEGFERTKKLVESAGDTSAYDTGLKTFQNSRFARQQNAANKEEFTAWQADKDSGRYTWGEHQKDQRVIQDKAVKDADGPLGRMGVHAINAIDNMSDKVHQWIGETPKDVGYTPQEVRNQVNEQVTGKLDPRVVRPFDEVDMTKGSTRNSDRELNGKPIAATGIPKGMVPSREDPFKFVPAGTYQDVRPDLPPAEVNVNRGKTRNSDRERDGTPIPTLRRKDDPPASRGTSNRQVSVDQSMTEDLGWMASNSGRRGDALPAKATREPERKYGFDEIRTDAMEAAIRKANEPLIRALEENSKVTEENSVKPVSNQKTLNRSGNRE